MSILSTQTKKKISNLAKPAIRKLCKLGKMFTKTKVVVPFEPPAQQYEEEEEEVEALPSTYLGAPPLTPPELLKAQTAQLIKEIPHKMTLRTAIPPTPKTPVELHLEGLRTGRTFLSKTETTARPTFTTHSTPFRLTCGESQEEDEEDDPEMSLISEY